MIDIKRYFSLDTVQSAVSNSKEVDIRDEIATVLKTAPFSAGGSRKEDAIPVD